MFNISLLMKVKKYANILTSKYPIIWLEAVFEEYFGNCFILNDVSCDNTILSYSSANS